MEKIYGIIISLFLILGCVKPCMAREAEEHNQPNAIMVSMNDGSSITYAFHDNPTITFDGDAIVIACENYTTEHALADMKHYSFVYDPSGVTDAATDQLVIREGDFVIVNCHNAGTIASLYNAAGQLIASDKTDASGVAQFSLSTLPSGVYLLTFDGKSSKIIKR